MTIKNSFSAVLICLALSGASAVAADVQQPATPKRATVKVKPKFFNPFDVQKTRLKINQYGFFTYLPSGALSDASAAATSANSLTTPQIVSTPPGQAASATSGGDAATATPLIVAAAPGPLTAAAGLSLSQGTVMSVASASGAMASFAAAADTTSVAEAQSRPPFRPPVRSPFRPPPRPPF
jgi:hypothetical protein